MNDETLMLAAFIGFVFLIQILVALNVSKKARSTFKKPDFKIVEKEDNGK